MIGKLLAQMRLDALKFVSSGGSEDDIIITSPDGAHTLAFTSWVSGRWQNFQDNNGLIVASASSHVNIHEDVLTAAAYPVRSLTTGKVKLEGHKIQAKDNNGVVRNYVIDKCLPNSTTGLIVCILGQAK